MSAPQNTCPCPQGYVRDQSGLNCVKTTSVAATNNGATYTIGTGNQVTSYGISGARFYQDITSLSFPIKYPNCANHNLVDNASSILTVQNLVAGTILWGDGNALHGRLNNAGIWTNLNGTPTCEFIGFSACVDVPVDGVYCIGMAADNATRFSIDSQLIVEIDNTCTGAPCEGGPGNCPPQTINGISYPSGTCPPCSTGAGCGNGFPFNYWHVFPITLSAGIHIITLEGKNFCCQAAFAAEIYNATPAQLAAMTTPAQLSAVTIFTTENKTGTFQSGQFSGYSCPPGYSLNTCGQSVTCSIIESIPYNCCYQLTNCVTGDIIITSIDLSANVGGVVTISEQAGCWSVTTALDCTTTVVVTVTGSFGSCQECAPCFRLTNCITGQVIVTSTNLSSSVGQTVNLSGQYAGCWTVTSSPNCDNSVAVVYVSTSVNCISCLPCFKLINCVDPNQIVTTNIDLSQYVGQSVQISGYPDVCWTIESTSGCTQSSNINITKSFSNCVECAKKCYILSDCAGEESSIITDSDLLQYVGQIVQLKDCGNHCWMVNTSNTCRGSVSVIVSASFATCELCAPPLVCPAPELLHQRKIYPGYNTPGCSTEYTEKVNCEFAEQIYTQVKQRRYGISPCCQEEFQKWTIKKKLLDLRAIWDPELCVTCPPITCCTPCPIPDPPVPPTPTGCPAPTDITAVIEIITPCPPDTGPTTATITFNKSSTTGFHPIKF